MLSTGATAVGYASTLLQQIVMARALGVDANVDALAASIGWVAATSGIVGWTLALAVVPRYIAALSAGREDAARLFQTAAVIAAASSVTVAALSIVLADALAVALLSGSSPQTQRTAATLIRITCPLQVIWTFTILGSSLANARHIYVAPALATVIPSLVIVATLITRPAVEAAAIAYVVGTAMQLVVLLASGRSWRHDLVPSYTGSTARRLATPLLPVGLSLAALNLALVAARSAASIGKPGDVAALDYALRLTAALESVLLAGGLQVALTIWSEQEADSGARSRPARAFLVAALAGSGAAIALVVLAHPLVSMLFGGGNFDAADVALVSVVLIAVAPAVPARMELFLVHRLQIARGVVWRAAAISVIAVPAVGVAVLAGTLLVGVVGSGVGFSVGWIAVAAIALGSIMLRQKVGQGSGAMAAHGDGALEARR